MCEELRYNGQRRRDVPDLASGTLYIDVGDRATRRKRHSFHHELWHMVDFHLLGTPHHLTSPFAGRMTSRARLTRRCGRPPFHAGNAFEAHDAEWAVHNPPGFKYGHGGKNMRTDSSSSQLSSSPSAEFLNRYSTSSIAEDKAEIWASLMCYQQVGPHTLLTSLGHVACSLLPDMGVPTVLPTGRAATPCHASPDTASTHELHSHELHRPSLTSHHLPRLTPPHVAVPASQVLKTPALKAKACLLQKRAKAICPQMDDKWWVKVVEAQRKLIDHWEVTRPPTSPHISPRLPTSPHISHPPWPSLTFSRVRASRRRPGALCRLAARESLLV